MRVGHDYWVHRLAGRTLYRRVRGCPHRAQRVRCNHRRAGRPRRRCDLRPGYAAAALPASSHHGTERLRPRQLVRRGRSRGVVPQPSCNVPLGHAGRHGRVVDQRAQPLPRGAAGHLDRTLAWLSRPVPQRLELPDHCKHQPTPLFQVLSLTSLRRASSSRYAASTSRPLPTTRPRKATQDVRLHARRWCCPGSRTAQHRRCAWTRTARATTAVDLMPRPIARRNAPRLAAITSPQLPRGWIGQWQTRRAGYKTWSTGQMA